MKVPYLKFKRVMVDLLVNEDLKSNVNTDEQPTNNLTSSFSHPLTTNKPISTHHLVSLNFSITSYITFFRNVACNYNYVF